MQSCSWHPPRRTRPITPVGLLSITPGCTRSTGSAATQAVVLLAAGIAILGFVLPDKALARAHCLQWVRRPSGALVLLWNSERGRVVLHALHVFTRNPPWMSSVWSFVRLEFRRTHSASLWRRSAIVVGTAQCPEIVKTVIPVIPNVVYVGGP